MKRLLVVMVLVSIAPASAQQQAPGQHIQISGMMRDMRDVLSPGWIEGSLYNEHPTKAVRMSEITVNSSTGKRIFKFNCAVAPQEAKEFTLPTGLRLDFRGGGGQKSWWGITVTRAQWTEAAGVPPGRCPERE